MEDILEIKAFFDACAPNWDQSCVHDSHKMAAIVTLAQVGTGTRVLDIGCGTGVLFPELLSRGIAELVGADLSEGMLRVAAKKCQDPRVRYFAGDFLEFSETGFDVAIIYSAYPHFSDKAALARRVWGALVPGGRILVAHSESRETINSRHRHCGAEEVSSMLRPVQEEASVWEEFFELDTWADRMDSYFFSGRRRATPAGKPGTALK